MTEILNKEIFQPVDTTDDLDGKVAIVGGGIAGITAAIKLFRQGYYVTLFEKSDVLGGNLSSNSISNIYNDHLDVYPHIFGDWYKEFWYLLEQDLEFNRQDKFVRRDKIKMAIVGSRTSEFKNFDDVPFMDLGTPTSLANFINNLDSKIMSKRDMFLFGYTYLNLACVPRGSGAIKNTKRT